ncbi:MAG: entericidin A/B family lipoprotein [Thiobacillus sp.]|jgi:predicted small secreted protein|nr:entericidin A/B family lipoprotein [Thiobacillus sp.]MDT3707764.1 entericidin A/B family lipoprotein [Thiobacillus sp.]
MKPMIAVALLAGGNTVKGLGQDIEMAGTAIERAGDK